MPAFRRPPNTRFPAWLIAVAAVMLLAPAAGAQQPGKTYYVVQIHPEGIDGIVLSLGRGSGAEVGQKVRIFRTVEVKHPVTGQKMRDRFPLGDRELIEVGRTLSVCEDFPEEEVYEEGEEKTVAVAKPRKKSRIKVGDQVEILSGARTVVYPHPAAGKKMPWSDAKTATLPAAECPEVICPSCPETPGEMDAATMAVLAAWNHSLGKPIPERIKIWDGFLESNPESPYVKRIRSEISSLKLQLAEKKRLAQAASEAVAAKPLAPESRALHFKHQAATKIHAGQPLHVAVAASKLEPIRAADVFYRQVESPTYKKAPMGRDGDMYLRAELAAEELSPPGVEYFIEAVDDKGAVHAVTGSKDTPRKVTVEDPPGLIKTERRNRSRVSLLYEYVDFTAGEGREQGPDKDTFMRFEADFLYRIMTMLYSIRVGCGVYTGSGGKIDTAGSRDVGFNYGYTELEFRFHEYFSVMGKVILGLNAPPGQEAAGLAGGFEGKIRIGRELGTNLVMGGAILEDIGVLGLIELTWDVVKYFPMTGRVEVTTQPVQEDIGVRILYQIGVSALDWFRPTLHVGLALRRIDHYGVSLGASTVFQW